MAKRKPKQDGPEPIPTDLWILRDRLSGRFLRCEALDLNDGTLMAFPDLRDAEEYCRIAGWECEPVKVTGLAEAESQRKLF